MSLQKVGRYEIVGELGRGAMGVVYKALDPTIGRTVALKTMRIDVHGLETEDVIRRFKNEARAAGLLNHPNIVTIYDAGEQDGIFYLAMEYIEGTTLHSLLAERRVLPPEEIVTISRQICKGLDYAHLQKIIHRDIKPGNIMLTPDGTVKIMDFGIAKAGASMTSTGQVLGTPNYMSPEQVKGKTLDGRSDLFSFGVVLYEMVTGEKPFVGQNVTTIIYKIVNENPIPPRDLDVTIHPGLSAVVTKTLAKSPDERYQTGAELIHDLDNYKAAGTNLNTTTVLSAGVSERTQPLSTTTAAAAAAVAPARSTPAAAQRPAAAAVHPHRRIWPLLTTIALIVLSAALGTAYYVRHAMLKVQQADRELQRADNELQRKLKEQQAAAATAKAVETATATPDPSAEKQPPPAEEQEKPKTLAISPNKVYSHQGELRFNSQPDGARVEVDGWTEPNWITPFRASNLAAGVHNVSFSKPGYIDNRRSITAVAGKSILVNVQLAPAGAKVSVTSTPPGANIFVDGKDTGKTTPADMLVETGEHTILLRKGGFRDVSTTERLAQGQPLTFSPILQPLQIESTPKQAFWRKVLRTPDTIEPGKALLHIRTEPEGATIMVRNKVAPEKTNVKWQVDPGAYEITLKMDGYKPVTRLVVIQKGQTKSIDEILEKQP